MRPCALVPPIMCATVGLLCGCATTDRGYVQREWSLTLRELGIVPVFPPREDVYVGDVYSYQDDPDSAEQRVLFESSWEDLTEEDRTKRLRQGMSPRAFRIPLGPVAAAEYAATPSLPATTTVYDGILDEALISQAREEVFNRTQAVETQTESVRERIKAAEAAKGTPNENAAQEALNESESRLSELKAELKSATQRLKGIENQRIKRLYAQPRDHTYSIFDGAKLSSTGADDLLNTRVNRARLVGFPDFASARFSKGDLSAIIPIEAFALGLDASWEQIKEVSVSIPAAESYAVSVGDILPHLTIDWRFSRDAVDNDALAQLSTDLTQIMVLNGVQAEFSDGFDVVDILIKSLVDEAQSKKYLSDQDFAPRIPEQRAKQISATAIDQAHTRVFEYVKHRMGLKQEDELTKSEYPFWLELYTSEGVQSLLLDAMIQGLMRAGELHAISWKLDSSIPLLQPQIHKAALFGAQSMEDYDYYYIRLVTEVFYARAIDVSIRASRQKRTQVDVQANVPASGTPTPNSSNTSQASLAGGGDMEQPKESIPVIGGEIEVISRTSSSVGLRRVYDRPIAVGFRGLTLTIRKSDGAIVSAQYPNSSTSMLHDEVEP